MMDRPRQPTTVDLIRGAMLENPMKTIKFVYEGSDGVPGPRRGEPYKMDMEHQRVFCYDIDQQGPRWFSFDKMSKVEHGEGFRPRFTVTVPL